MRVSLNSLLREQNLPIRKATFMAGYPHLPRNIFAHTPHTIYPPCSTFACAYVSIYNRASTPSPPTAPAFPPWDQKTNTSPSPNYTPTTSAPSTS
jgi:hypothetical protein